MPQFLDLPPEIIIMIASRFLPSWEDVFINLAYRDSWRRAQHARLNSLSRTCRALRHLVQPVLYRCPLAEGSRCMSLVRTIYERPDLASAVRDMYIGPWKFTGSEEVTDENVGFLNFLQGELAKYPKYPDNPTPGSVMAALVVTQIPNVERLRVYCNSDAWWFYHLPGSLPRLECLSVHWMEMELGVDLAVVRNLLLSAPNLKRLEGRKISDVSNYMRHDSVKELDIKYSSIEEVELTPLLGDFKNLESFTYTSGGSFVSYCPEVTPGMISDALLQVKDTLRHVCIAMEYKTSFDWEAGENLCCFRDLTSLEALDLYVNNGPSNWGPEIKVAHPDSFIRILPPSIQSFQFGMPPWHFQDALLRLAEAVPGQFPRLKELLLEHSRSRYVFEYEGSNSEYGDEGQTVYEENTHWENRDLVTQAFEACGVQVEFFVGRPEYPYW